MRILALECSATPASCAVINDGFLEAASFINVKLTHSQTLLKMTADMLSAANIPLSQIDGFCISSGPGSFTGVRIGISALKGLACAGDKPCVAVSSLRAMAENFKDRDCIVCAVMDARCNQVYNALFKIEGGKIKRLCEDRALKCSELADEIKRKRTALPIIVAGDGVDVFYPFVEGKQNVQKAMPHNKYQTATGVAFAALDDFLKGNTCSSGELLPAYLRLPQAERELKAKRGNE